MTRLEYVGKLLRAAYDQAHPGKLNSTQAGAFMISVKFNL